MSRWWRAYDDALHDPKVQALPPALFKFWFNVLCAASKNDGVIPPLVELKALLKARLDHVETHLKDLLTRGLVDEIDGRLEPHNWRKRQYKSDNSTDRVRVHRNGKRNVSETPPDNRVQNTETENKEQSAQDAPAAQPAKPPRENVSRGTLLPADWQPSDADFKFATDHGLPLYKIDVEATKFRNYWTSKAGAAARKRDWSRTWENWILNVKPNGGQNGPRSTVPKQHPSDLAFDLADEARRLERAAGIGR